MKKLFSIIILCLLWFSNIKAQEFYPNKELDIDKLINFDLNKYKFTEYKDIIGNNVRSWNGNPEELSQNVKDWKAINVKINDEEYELRLNHFKTGEIGFFILIRGLSCETAKSIIPIKYIKKENSLAYTSDWDEFGKLYIEKFSYDTNKNTRLFSGCIAMLNESNIGSVEDVTFSINIFSQNSPNVPPVVPLKMIRCDILQYKNKYKLDSNNLRTMNYTFKDMPQKVTRDYYISDSEDELLNGKFREIGNKTIRFDRDLIHIEQTYELDKTKVDRLFTYEEYKIDRINGDFFFNKREYDKEYTSILTPNNEIELQYKGKCEKKDINERAF
jgi:hypothetical protein